jgi:hypothetical protein
MTKAQQIREFFKQGLADLDIAQRVGCREEYVRVVRQRTDANGKAKLRPSDMPWSSTAACYVRYHSDDQYRMRRQASNRRWKAKRRAEARAS